MTIRRKRAKPSNRVARTLQLHARFAPGVRDSTDTAAFIEFWSKALERINELNTERLRLQKIELGRKSRLNRKVASVVAQALREQIPIAEAAAEIERLVPDKKTRRELADSWPGPSEKTPQHNVPDKQEAARSQAELVATEKALKAHGLVIEGVAQLNEMAGAGNAKAAKMLTETATLVITAITALEVRQPEIIGQIARRTALWPVLTGGEVGWEKRAARRIAGLNLGADMGFFRARFRQPRGAEVNLPARVWAKAAVRVLEETRFRLLAFGELAEGFGSVEALAGYCEETGWDLCPSVAWAQDLAGLSAFSMASLPSWKRAIRKMIRQQMPDFHTRSEWATQRASAVARERGTPGEIQNAILDDITSALERLAPLDALPKSGG